MILSGGMEQKWTRLAFVFNGPIGQVQVDCLEELHRDGLRLNVEVVFGQAHQQEEGSWREDFQQQRHPAPSPKERTAAANLKQEVLVQHSQELPPWAWPVSQNGVGSGSHQFSIVRCPNNAFSTKNIFLDVWHSCMKSLNHDPESGSSD